MRLFSLVLMGLCGLMAVATASNPCDSIQCEKPLLSCLKLLSGEKHATFKCECAMVCNNVNIINVPIVQRIKAENVKKLNYGMSKNPTLKQGGAACYSQPNYCMNGGTCYTQYTQATLTTASTTTAATTTQDSTTQETSTTTSTTSTTTTTTTTTTTPETTTRYTWISQPVCGCQPQFNGDRCEIPVPTTVAPITSPQPTTVSWNNLCKVYADRNMNICQNGGQCVFISDGKVACVCPSMYIGQYCETPVYARCLGPLNAQCHRDFGTCQPDGSCLCNAGYCGISCDQRVVETTIAPSRCLSYYCQNGGTCQTVNIDPYVVCICPSEFTGSRCETAVTIPTTETTTTTTTTLASMMMMVNQATLMPRCNFTISVLNDGAFTARFKVHHSIDGILQPIYVSDTMPFIGQKQSIEIPWYSQDIMVSLERLGFSWSEIKLDLNVDPTYYCTKCYKVWGSVTNPSWDYMEC